MLDLAELYKIAVGFWGIAPSEFMGMTLREWWLVYDVKRQDRQAGGLSEDQKSELWDMLTKAEEKANGRG